MEQNALLCQVLFLKKNLECSPPISHSVCPLRLLFVLSTNIG